MKYAPNNSTGTVIAGTTGVSGTNASLFSTGLRALHIDSNQNLYVVGAGSHRVMRWGPGATSGVRVAGNGTNGSSLNQLGTPYGVWVDSSSNVFVAEFGNHRITKWAPGATAGVIVAGVNCTAGKNNDTKII